MSNKLKTKHDFFALLQRIRRVGGVYSLNIGIATDYHIEHDGGWFQRSDNNEWKPADEQELINFLYKHRASINRNEHYFVK